MATMEDDPIEKEINVYLSKALMDKLYIFQYPVRPLHMTYDDTTYLEARIKPEQQKVELEVALNTTSFTYDRSKGEQIALNVDGNKKDERSFYRSSVMDKQILSSTRAVTSTGRYAVGLLKNGSLHLNPLHGIIQLRPSFCYLDRSDAKQRQENRESGEGESSAEEGEEEATPIQVKFARPESEKFKLAKEKSYRFLQQKMAEESWIQSEFHHFKSEKSMLQVQQLLCSQMHEDITELHLKPKEYLQMLIPENIDTDFNKPSLPSNALSMSQLRTMPLGDQVKALLIRAKIIQFNQLQSLLVTDVDSTSLLRALQQVASLVQGCWIVKSDILYPEKTCSHHSGIPAEILCRGRDYVMWKFTQSRYIVRKEVASVIKLPQEDVKEILEQMARIRISKGWEFILPFDSDFIARYPDVVQRQQMLWDVRYQQLCKSLKISDSKAKISEVSKVNSSPVKKQPKPTKSKELPNLASTDSFQVHIKQEPLSPPYKATMESSFSQCNNFPVKIKQELMDCEEQMDVSSTNNFEMVSNGPSSVTNNHVGSDQLQTELMQFVQERLHLRKCMSLSELKRALTLKLAESAPGHILGRGVSDCMLEQTAVQAGAVNVNCEWPPGSTKEPLFAVMNSDNEQYKWCEILFNMFHTSTRYRKSTIKKRIEETLGISIPENEFLKFIKDYCIGSRNGMYSLKGTVPSP